MQKDQDLNRHYSLRKLSVGLASVLIGLSFAGANGQKADAATINNNNSAKIETANSSEANNNEADKSEANNSEADKIEAQSAKISSAENSTEVKADTINSAAQTTAPSVKQVPAAKGLK